MNWYLEVLKKYAVFSGRARRKEYWYYFLFNFLFMTAFLMLDNTLGLLDKETGVGVISSIYALAVLLPGLAVAVRRLHDSGRRGWWVLIAVIPLIGAIVLIFLLIQESTPGDNAYGPNPIAQDSAQGFPG